MTMRYVRLLVGAFGGLALLLAACAPAAESEGSTTSTTTSSTDTTTSSTEMVLPAASSEAESGAAATSTETAMEEKGPTSVSGIPLDPDAEFGGIYQASGSRDNQWLVWEQCCANTFHTTLADGILRYRTWGTEEEFKAGAFTQVVPDLAYSWEQSADGMQWTFLLQEGVTFHDGEPFTCEDAAWSMERNRTGEQLNTSPRGAHIAQVESFTCADDYTLVATMKRPKPALPQIVALPEFSVLPKHLYDGNLDEARANPVTGTGPFVIQEWVPGEKVVYTRNENYWDKPFPYLDGIEQTIIRQSAAVVAAVRAGRVYDNSPQSGAQAQTLQEECDLCYSFPVVSNVGQAYALIPNMERYPWNLPEVRTALSLAIDRTKQRELAYQGFGTLPTGGLFLPGSGWEMPYERVKQIPGLDLERPREEVVAEAKALLASAGFGPGDLKFVHLGAQSPNYIPYAIPMVEQLAEVGIEMTIEEVERGPYYDAMANGNFDVGGHAGYFRGTDPDGLFYEFYYPGSDRNYGRYSNPEAKRLIDLQSSTLDPEKRKELAWDAAELILRDVVRTFNGFTANQNFFNKKVRGVIGAPNAMAGHWRQQRHTWLDE